MKLALHEWGDRSHPTLVCVHGVTSHGRRFAPLAPHLERHFHLLAPDLRAHGDSGWEPPWSLEQHLEDLLDSVPAEAALWLGHSFGGRLVLELVAARPERVARAVLLDPALWVPPPLALEEAEAQRADESFASLEEAVAARLASRLDRGVGRELLEQDFRAHLARSADGRLRFRYSRSGAIAAYGEMARTPPLVPLERPVLIARAAASRVCPPELVEAFQESCGALLTSVELPGGHTVMWDAPAETAAVIEQFMVEPRSGAGAR